MTTFSFKLKFTGAVHFGERSGYLETVHETVGSDTLFSALINTVSVYFGKEEAKRWIEDFIENPPFLISSLFLYNNNKTFLPKPLDDSFIDSSVKSALGKELKKIRWLNLEDFVKWCKREPFTEQQILGLRENLSFYESAYTVDVRPRVTLDRMTNQSSLYFVGSIKFKKNAGLHGFVKFRDLGYIEKFQRILVLLGETGLGGEKTYGYGMFKVSEFKESKAFEEILNTDFKNFTLLSLYHPSDTEFSQLKNSLVAYDIKKKTGFITSGRHAMPFKRKSVGFITEGSVVKEPVKGTLVDVTPDELSLNVVGHRIFRYGYAFLVP